MSAHNPNPFPRPFETQGVPQRNPVEERVKLMIPVLALAKDTKKEIELGWR